ncbi:DUF5710 domain-containing protein [Methylomonas methanica]|uniref:DUF5710 domain-containing protein n=1 Tax=Methylomonas methanica (strain DSM 25384 / MC09) TaxID=857087 RepID=G0A3R8_METMM|nr:DUF5710 domain-containing protein [Methylomonas methanica]AEG01540.1 hypothetical protein Metme_3165 [Methylomonas methanica MC09]
MAKSITYLNVPYAQKDAAKALGARWDAANKKWYVPIDKDVAPFAQWLCDFVPQQPDDSVTPTQLAPKASPIKKTASATANSGVFTFPTTPDFVPYAGEEPPWD